MEIFEKSVFAVILVAIVSVTGCVGHTSYLVAHSPDPIAASCAMGWSREACAAVLARRP